MEDWEFALRFAKQNKIGYVGELLVDVYLSGNGVSSGAGAYFEGRCSMLVKYQEELVREEIFEKAIFEIFEKAQQGGVLEPVKKMLMAYLTETG